MASGADLDAERSRLLGELQAGGVTFVLIGGAALETHAQPHVTRDVDITPATDAANLGRLAQVLNGLGCSLRVDEDDRSSEVVLPGDYFTAETLRRADLWNLRTRHGELDVALKPAGFPFGFRDLQRGARPMLAAGTQIQVDVASLEDVEHSKRTAGRRKDLEYLDRVGRRQGPDLSLEL